MSCLYKLTLAISLCYFSAIDQGHADHTTVFDPLVESLFDRVQREQVLTEQPFRTFRSWQKIKGIYSSDIILNFHGRLLPSLMRRHFHIFDNNMFALSWVTSSLLEAFRLGGSPPPSEKQLLLSVIALRDFQDKNVAYNTSVMTFWQQQLNQSSNYWKCVPVNLVETLRGLDRLPLSYIESVLKALGLEKLARFIERVIEQKSDLLRSFQIPPDFDDTFVNLGLGSLLHDLKNQFPSVWNQWNTQNENLTSVFTALKKYAYRPFSNNSNINTIDPRTYYHIRDFLDQAKTRREDISLITTWAQDLEELRQQLDLGVGMPFEVNNVDLTVAANVIYGVTSGVLSGLVSQDVLNDKDVAQLLLNTTSLISHEISNNFSGRPDLALTYYPSPFEFYWFVSRTKSLLETASRNGTLTPKNDKTCNLLAEMLVILREVTEGRMTRNILSKARTEEPDSVFFDNFLGNGDFSWDGKPLIRGEDRIFTTSMAANALLYTWSVYDDSTLKSHWKNGTPREVLKVVQACVTWLRRHSLDTHLDPWNTFFSSSVKGFESLPFWYPANRLEYLNGTVITDWADIPNTTFIYGVEGYIPVSEYNSLLLEKHFGSITPTNFTGYNSGKGFFPLWSSVPYTYSTTLLTLSKFGNTAKLSSSD